MSDIPSEIQTLYQAYVSAIVTQLDPAATEGAIARYLAEIETMAVALNALDVPETQHVAPFSAEWLDEEPA